MENVRGREWGTCGEERGATRRGFQRGGGSPRELVRRLGARLRVA